jgi:hypothetical protein
MIAFEMLLNWWDYTGTASPLTNLDNNAIAVAAKPHS